MAAHKQHAKGFPVNLSSPSPSPDSCPNAGTCAPGETPARERGESGRSGNTVIESIGVYLPPKRVSSNEIVEACRNTLQYPLERLTGIQFRRMAGDFEFAIDLAKQAIAKALANSRYAPAEIELLICCNISRYDGPGFQFSFEPSTAVRLRQHFGLERALVFDISNACAGMFTGIYIADTFLKAGLVRNALIVSGEYITHLTRTAQYEIDGERDERLACLTVGDSGAAVILERAAVPGVGFHTIDMFTLGAHSSYCIAKPTSSPAGGAIMLTDSLRIHAVAIKSSVTHLFNVLKALHWPRKNFQHVIMHQTAKTAIMETARQINEMFHDEICHRGNMVNNLAERGNTSSTTHIVAIWDHIHNGNIKNGDNVVFAIQASGITIGTAPYTFDDLPERVRAARKPQPPPPAAARAWVPPLPLPGSRPTPRVCIDSVGLAPRDPRPRLGAIDLAHLAGEDCFARTTCDRNEVTELIHCGVHREEFICEPAIAALIAGKLRVNAEVSSPGQNKTFAYDIINGASGLLNACFNAVAIVRARTRSKVLVLSAEIENNYDVKPDHLLGLIETGAALLLHESPDPQRGFGNFVFKYFTEHLGAFSSYIGQDKEQGKSFLAFSRDARLHDYFIDCIPAAVQELLEREKIDIGRIKAVFPPQLSPEFAQKLAQRLGVAVEKFVDIAQDRKDYYTNSFAHALRYALDRKIVQSGDIGLIINAGSGIQIGCAVYYF